MRFLLCSTLLVLLLAASNEAGEPDPVRSFSRRFRKSRAPVNLLDAREEALARIKDVGGIDAAEALLQAAGHLEDEAAAMETQRRKQLDTARFDRFVQARVDFDRHRALQDGVEDALLALREQEVVTHVFTQALSDDALPLTLRIRLVREKAAAAKDSPATVTAALQRAREPADVSTALVAVKALAKRAEGAAAASAIARIESRDVVVCELAADAAAALGLREAVKPLIDRLSRERGGTANRLGVALEHLTGKRLDTSADAWRRWWAAEGDELMEGHGAVGAPRGSASAEREEARYHGIPLDGEALLFVFDRSNSMSKAMERSNGPSRSGATRIEAAKKELIRALGQLPPTRTLNIVTFAKQAHSFSPEMLRATPANVERAQQWVRDMELKFGTALYDGLNLGFALAGRPARDRLYSASIDTMFVITDGRPKAPDVTQPKGLVNDGFKRIRREVRRWNLLDRVVVHTIGLGAPLPKKFLEKLASDNGGQFTHIE